MDIQEVKKMIGISNTDKHDGYLEVAVPLFVEFALERCSNANLDKDKLPAGVKIFVAKAVEHNMGNSSLKGRTMGGVSYSYETDLPKTIMDYLNPYKRMRMR